MNKIDKKIQTPTALFSLLLILVILSLVLDSPKTTLSEAKKSLGDIEFQVSDLDSLSRHCSTTFSARFVETASTVGRLVVPTSLLEALEELAIVNDLGTVMVQRNNALCNDGRYAGNEARTAVVKRVNNFFASASGDTSIEDELILLNQIPGNEPSLQEAVRDRLGKKGCKTHRNGFVYVCE